MVVSLVPTARLHIYCIIRLSNLCVSQLASSQLITIMTVEKHLIEPKQVLEKGDISYGVKSHGIG